MISQEKYDLPNGLVTKRKDFTKGDFYFWITNYYLKNLVRYNDRFLDFQRPTFPPYMNELDGEQRERVFKEKLYFPPALPNGVDSVKDLEPNDAAWALHLMINPVDDYQRTIEVLRPYAQRNPDIGIILDVLEERVSALLEVAKNAEPEVLKAAGLESLLIEQIR